MFDESPAWARVRTDAPDGGGPDRPEAAPKSSGEPDGRFRLGRRSWSVNPYDFGDGWRWVEPRGDDEWLLVIAMGPSTAEGRDDDTEQAARFLLARYLDRRPTGPRPHRSAHDPVEWDHWYDAPDFAAELEAAAKQRAGMRFRPPS